MRQLSEKVRLVLRYVVHIHDLAELVDCLEVEVFSPQGENGVVEHFSGRKLVRERPVAENGLRK